MAKAERNNSMSKLLEQFNKEYDFLYEAKDYVAGYNEAVEWFDTYQSDPSVKPFRDALIQERGDLISSDREAGAFAFACEVLGITEGLL